MIKQLIANERFTNVQTAQAGLTRLLLRAQKRGIFYRLFRNNQAIGVLLPENLWRSIIEDIEALSSPNFRARIKKARAESKRISASFVKKELGLT